MARIDGQVLTLSRAISTLTFLMLLGSPFCNLCNDRTMLFIDSMISSGMYLSVAISIGIGLLVNCLPMLNRLCLHLRIVQGNPICCFVFFVDFLI